MAKRRNTSLFDQLHAQGLRKRVARAIADLESGGKKAGAGAEKSARDALANLRTLTADLEKRLSGSTPSSSRRAGAKKAAATRKRAATKRSGAAKKAAATRKRASSVRKSAGGARKTTGRKKTTARKSPRKSTSRARKR